ncbi:dTDP-Rha--alpha-D-GlcNAc-pyrophosphate polyprenol alpha-3-L-rhamnosyltransferase [Flavobacterium sp. LM5]|uniref:glycosyltransferase family 2 protein n=1 Tax=Flavobacterium sp. LM5 TaxID=1938610 RepID=UPI00099387F8|nr:glycosyltransferase family 2 protein [Flavobacterium sp. LM5]OOV27874.1 dTDP-Rha--alpha-D-GlcNAc-pyrophosphate polyprenol alpha-3-L-rhamnosyltransferase [Flavobacterium sp. LM5]
MTVAVVILNWNGISLLEQFLPTIIAHSPQATIYVADNASTDASVSFVQANFPSVQIIQNKANYGFAGGYNEALKKVTADIFVLVNSDVEVTPNWLEPMISTFENEPKTAILQPKILDFKNKAYFEYAGAAGGYIDKYGFPFCRGRIFDTIEKDLGQYDDVAEIFWASGACFFIRSEVYTTLAGFDASFFAHQEEIDLCWRAINKGYTIKYNPKSVVYHVGGATLQQGNPKKTELNFRNSLFMLTKNLPKKVLYSRLFIRMLLDGIAGLQFLAKGKPKHFFSVLKAHVAFYQYFSKCFGKRGAVQKEAYYKVKSVVFSYFIKNGTIFEKLV